MIRFTPALRQSRAQATITAIAAAGAGAKLRAYTAPVPAGIAEAVTSQILLFEVPLAHPCGTATEQGLAFADTPAVLVLAAGRAAWVRIVGADDAAVLDLDVGAIGSAAHFQMAEQDLLAGSIFDLANSALLEP